MANIVLSGLFEQKQREFNMQGNGVQGFKSDFIDGVNFATRRINRDADLESRISIVTSTEDSVALSDEYTDVLSDLVTLHLINAGQRPRGGDDARSVTDIDRSMPLRIDAIRRDILNQAQEADTGDTSDFVALGGLG